MVLPMKDNGVIANAIVELIELRIMASKDPIDPLDFIGQHFDRDVRAERTRNYANHNRGDDCVQYFVSHLDHLGSLVLTDRFELSR